MTKYTSILMIAIVSFSSCKKEDPVIPNEEELITTLTYTLTPQGGGTTVELKFVDLDGDGGNAPTITGGTLAANTTYDGSLELLNESETPSENINTEIQAEDADHQFFFATNIAGLTFTYTDQDGNNNPVGLTSTATTTAAGSGNLTVTLRHEPNKSGTNVSSGDITNAGGETDIEVIFPVDVQ